MGTMAVAVELRTIATALLIIFVSVKSTYSFGGIKIGINRNHKESLHYSKLWAKRKSNSKRKTRPSTSGFGGAAADPCPCGGGIEGREGKAPLSYMKCCGPLHKNFLSEYPKA